MKKLLFLVVVLLVMAGWTMAQTSGSNTSGQTGTSAGQQQTTPDQTGQAGQTSPDQTSSQSTTESTTTETQKTGKKGKLPQTASPLPLLGLLGAGSLTAGLATRRRKH